MIEHVANPLSPADQAELARILAAEPRFVDHPSFHLPDAERAIFAVALPAMADLSWLSKRLYRSSVGWKNPRVAVEFISEEQDRAACLQFNFCRMQVARLAPVAATDPQRARELLAWHRRGMAMRDVLIAQAAWWALKLNRRWQCVGIAPDDVIAEGMLAAIKLLERWDCSHWDAPFYRIVPQYIGRGMQNLIIREAKRGFAGKIAGVRDRQVPCTTDLHPVSDALGERRAEHQAWLVERLRVILDENRAGLTRDELRIVKSRYGGRVVLPFARLTRKLRAGAGTLCRRLHSAFLKLRAAVQRVMRHETIFDRVSKLHQIRLAAA